MTVAIIIEKDGNIKETNIKNDKLEYLAKKCNFKNEKNFNNTAKWKVSIKNENYNINLYAKATGRANNENKYDLPPPVDTVLYFGTIILINYNNDNELSSLTKDEWDKIYEKLFGGFEDLANTADEDELEEDELDDIDDEFKTKEGYLKDGFVVDDSIEDLSSEDYDSELSEEEYIYSDEN
jgi:hypothetical protein